MDTKTVARRIRSLCVDRGITYEQLAESVGVPTSTMKSWVYGERKMSLEAAYAIADYFHVAIDVIAGRVPAVVEMG